ncbi:MAG: hypothetical protein LLG13_03685 [Bacteroidales bacterium]|nr:hypothetical protein [Bacteroidales bacterium]
MKKQLLSALLLLLVCTAIAHAKSADQNVTTTATLKSSSRLFAAKDDLTSVILIIPSGTTVTVLDSDVTYLHVTYEKNEGYILREHAVINQTPVPAAQTEQTPQAEQEEKPASFQQTNRLLYLEKKYGPTMAARLYEGKIWKGMNSGMVKDSWGRADKVNRVINGNIIKEEWIYRGTWLYFENNTLLEWGPVKK